MIIIKHPFQSYQNRVFLYSLLQKDIEKGLRGSCRLRDVYRLYSFDDIDSGGKSDLYKPFSLLAVV